MSAQILVFDSSKEAGHELVEDIGTIMGTYMGGVNFSVHHPREVYEDNIQGGAAAFFTLSTMYDAEAARKFNAFHKEVPLVVVSDSDQFGLLSWQLDACYYLLRPLEEEKVMNAIHICVDKK